MTQTHTHSQDQFSLKSEDVQSEVLHRKMITWNVWGGDWWTLPHAGKGAIQPQLVFKSETEKLVRQTRTKFV